MYVVMNAKERSTYGRSVSLFRECFNPITGGGGGGGPNRPPASFSALYGKRLKIGT